MQTVDVQPPLNIDGDVENLFKPFLKYEIDDLKVLKLNEVFVCYSGYCLNDNGLIKESHHGYVEQFDKYLCEASYYYNLALRDSSSVITIEDENTYLLIHHPWYNYYHWLCECILRLWIVRDRVEDLILILPDYYAFSEYIMASLMPFKFKGIYFIPADKSLYIKNLLMPQIKPFVDSYYNTELKQISNFYKLYALTTRRNNLNLGERIYISRKKALRKSVANEEQLLTILKKYSFSVISNENYNFYQQVEIYSHANILISMHGSGLTNMIFMNNGSKILELHKKKTNNRDWHSRAFWYMASSLGHGYFQQVCDPTDNDDDYFSANFYVDVEKFESNIKMMVS